MVMSTKNKLQTALLASERMLTGAVTLCMGVRFSQRDWVVLMFYTLRSKRGRSVAALSKLGLLPSSGAVLHLLRALVVVL